MSIVMSLSPDLVSMSPANSIAQLDPGSNGSTWGDAEYGVGTGVDDMSEGRAVWDDDLSNGFDTMDQSTQIVADAAGTTMNISGIGSASSSDAAVNGISEVDLIACTQAANADAKWSNIVVQFYKGQTLTETDSVGTLEATGTSDAPTEEDLAKIVPSSGDNDRVVITGSIRLQCSEPDAVPQSTAMFCQALIYSS